MGSFLLDVVEFIILVLFLKSMARSIGSLFRSPGINVRSSGAAVRRSPPAAAHHQGEMSRDPVCGIFVSTELSQQLMQGAETVHFCSRECLEKYQKDAHHRAS
jgi:YHS domain-containing protein